MRIRVLYRCVIGPALFVCLVVALGGCFSKNPPVRLYPAYDGGVPVEFDEVFGRLSDGDRVTVVLSDGCRFEARYRGFSDGAPSFEDLQWLDPPADRCTAAGSGHVSWGREEIAQLLKHESSRADNIVAAVSVAAGVYMFYVYSAGQGGGLEE